MNAPANGPTEPRDLQDVTELCLAAAPVLEEHGTPRLTALFHLFLVELGREVARRMDVPQLPTQ